MSSLVIAGDSSGSVTLQAPSVAGSTTLNLPATSGTVLVSGAATGTGNAVLANSPTITTPTFSGGYTAPNSTGSTTFGFKNRIINGAMVIDQRNAGASVTPTTNQYTLDRWELYVNQSSKLSFQQNQGSVTPPAGFSNYMGLTSLSAYTVGSGDLFLLDQYIEGYNVADLNWGTANAKTVTLSFWVRSSLTGTFGGAFTNSGNARSYPFTYTISSANTWQQISITIAGDTSGTWNTTNGTGLGVRFSLGCGSTYLGTSGSWASASYFGATGQTNVVTTNGATFYITGVQLEVGTVATSFDYRPYGTELALCQRYAIQMAVSGYDNYQYYAIGYLYNTTTGTYVTYLPVPMRTTPTITSSGTLTASNLGINVSSLSAPTSQIGSLLTADFTLASTTTTNNPAFIRWANQSTKSLLLSAEL
jgi:hypothetical protein